MPLDYRLAMAAPQERFGTLKDIMAIGQLHDQDRKQQQARIDAAQEQQARQVMQQVFQQHADDPEQGIVELRRRGFLKQADELDKQLQGHRKALLENRKLDLEAQRLTGQIDGDAAEREIKAMAANSPEKILELYAGVTNPEEAEAAKGLMRFRFGAKAEPVIAMLGDYSPESVAFAGRTAMGPAKVADVANQNTDNERAAAQVAATEAARADTNARMSAASAEAARHNKVMEGQGAQRIGQARQAGAEGGTGGAKLSAANIEKVAGVDQSLGMMDDIDKLLPKMTGNIGVMDGRLASAKLATGVGVSQDLATFAAQLSGLKNAVIKATTGAAMSEPEAKRIMGQLPDLTQPETVFKARMETTRKNLELLKKRIIELSGGAVSAPAGPKTMTAEELIKKYGGG